MATTMVEIDMLQSSVDQITDCIAMYHLYQKRSLL